MSDAGRETGAAPRVSATVVTYNGAADVRACLTALFASQGGALDEVIVLDNASTDGTADLVETEFPRARVVRRPRNDGPCAARNEGLQQARHRLVFQVDQDVVVRPDCLARLLEEFAAHDAVAVAAPRALDAGDPTLVHYDGGSFHYAGVLALRHFYRPLAQCPRVSEDVDAFISLAALVDRDVLLRAGGYDPELFILFEDHDLSYRLRLTGARIRAVAAALVEHRSGTAGISFRGGPRYPTRRLFLHSRNRWLVVLKCYRLRTLLVALPGILLLGIAYVAFAAREGALPDYVKAKASLLRLLPHVRAERRRLAPLRRVRDRDLLKSPDLTFSPRIERGRGASSGEALLSKVLRAWWRLVRGLAG